MNDHQLDQLVATAALVDDGWVGTLDLRDAESELMEEIVSTPRTSVPTGPTETPMPGAPEPPAAPTAEELAPFRGAPRRRRRVRVAVGAAAAVVIAALAVGALLTRDAGEGDGDDQVWAAAGSGVVPAILDPALDGYEVALASDGDGSPTPPAEGGPPNTWVYGDLSDTGVANDIVIRVAPQAPGGTILSEPVTVRGTQGSLCSPGPTQCDFGNNITGVSWTDPSGIYLEVESRTYDADQVLAIAEGLVVEGGSATLGVMPAGVATPPQVAVLNDDWTTAHEVAYRAPDGGAVSVSTRAQTDPMRIYDLWRSGPRDGGEVNGHPASVEDIDGSYIVTWEPAAGQLVWILTNGMDEAAALDAAAAVRPATPAEWADVQEQAANAVPDEPAGESGVEQPPDDAAHRLLTDGVTEVWGWPSAEGGPCYKVTEGGSESRGCTGDPETMVVGISPSSTNNGPMETTPAAVGLAPAGTASIDGAEVTFGPDELGGRPFVCEFTDGEMHDTVTFRDAAGTDLGTAEVSVT